MSESAVAWAGTTGSNLIAGANDIIQWSGTEWQVIFDSNNNDTVQYLTNLTTNVQYRWTGTNWVKAYEGVYHSGFWSLVL